MMKADVIWREIEYQAHIARAHSVAQLLQRDVSAQAIGYVIKVANDIKVIGFGIKYGIEIDGGHTKVLQVIQMLRDAGQVAAEEFHRERFVKGTRQFAPIRAVALVCPSKSVRLSVDRWSGRHWRSARERSDKRSDPGPKAARCNRRAP